jgi:hypothetical protein
MTRFVVAATQSLVLAAFMIVMSFASGQESLKKDLAAVIALHGLPCGEVVEVQVRADNDYIATCKDGNKYHVYLNDAGRVVVEKQR